MYLVNSIFVRIAIAICALCALLMHYTEGFLFFTRAGSFGYLAAVAIPLDLPNRNVYVSFNFEANYGLPSNDSYKEWIQRWNYTNQAIGIGNGITPINNRKMKRSPMKYTRTSFYRSIAKYMDYMDLNSTGCLLRLICEISNENFEETSGVIGSVLRILFLPSTSAPEVSLESYHGIYDAEYDGQQNQCDRYTNSCPMNILGMFSKAF